MAKKNDDLLTLDKIAAVRTNTGQWDFSNLYPQKPEPTKEEIMKEYGITEKDIWSALDYAGKLIEEEKFHPLRKAS